MLYAQACLGAGAKDGERNVVEVTTENSEGEMVTHTLLSLRVGGTEQVSEQPLIVFFQIWGGL